MKLPETVFNRAKAIRLALFDVDGVLTDGNIYIDNHGTEMKAFNTHDGHGIRLLLHYGIEVGVITGRASKALEYRMQDLQVRHVYQSCKDKFLAFQNLLSKLNLEEHQAAFVGDDIFDLQVMSRCGLAVAVANAHTIVKQHAHCETENSGGHGAAREVCELLLDAQGLLDTAISHNLR
ncbi:MAG: 3-deoxy-manno-octulosonate-8-phosphatase KdsC [Gammaproteobacteria bacterium]|nr:3-deoxy-manno-octulosonate-8-phosphatase KdsC [Gammaproteobacteria bacterium]